MELTHPILFVHLDKDAVYLILNLDKTVWVRTQEGQVLVSSALRVPVKTPCKMVGAIHCTYLGAVSILYQEKHASQRDTVLH